MRVIPVSRAAYNFVSNMRNTKLIVRTIIKSAILDVDRRHCHDSLKFHKYSYKQQLRIWDPTKFL